MTGVAGLDSLEFQRGAGGVGNVLPVQLPLVGKRAAAVGCSPEGNRVAFRCSDGDRLGGDARRRALGRQFLGGAVQLDPDTGWVDIRRRIVDFEVKGVDALDKPGSDFELGESPEAAGGFNAGTFVVEQYVWATVIRGPLAGDGCRLVIEFGQVERDPIKIIARRVSSALVGVGCDPPGIRPFLHPRANRETGLERESFRPLIIEVIAVLQYPMGIERLGFQ